MEILSFKITGKFAHFRKYYANNTAFSFTIPPRTTLMGMVASFMGLERDYYYEILSSENIHFGIRVLTPLKKSFHRVNFLSIKNLGDMSKKFSSDFRGEGGRIQTPFELISGWDIRNDNVAYQVFITPVQNNGSTFDKIKEHFLNKHPVFNITMGTANFNATISDIGLIKENAIENVNSDDFILINSAIPVDHVSDLKFNKDDFDSYNFVEEDMMPGDFVANKNREVQKMNKLIFSVTPNPLRVKITKPCYKLRLPEEVINIQFMDA
ncbi:MAG TPA: CRISPR-associated protein Cas5 [Bacteroidales bacterium]|nr:CRISPR-associated protein Cas5 [Bacteroidales bacterium]